MQEARSLAASACTPLSAGEKQGLAVALQGLPTHQLEAAVALVVAGHPGGVSTTNGPDTLMPPEGDADARRQVGCVWGGGGCRRCCSVVVGGAGGCWWMVVVDGGAGWCWCFWVVLVSTGGWWVVVLVGGSGGSWWVLGGGAGCW